VIETMEPEVKETKVAKVAKVAKVTEVEDPYGPTHARAMQMSSDPKLNPAQQLKALNIAGKIEAAHLKMEISGVLTKQIKIRNRGAKIKLKAKEKREDFGV
jgi:hypothetical protein